MDPNEAIKILTNDNPITWLVGRIEYTSDLTRRREVTYYQYLADLANRFSKQAEAYITHRDIFDTTSTEILHFPPYMETSASVSQFLPDVNPDPSIAKHVRLNTPAKHGYEKLMANWPADKIRFATDLFWATPLTWHIARCRRFLPVNSTFHGFAADFIERFCQEADKVALGGIIDGSSVAIRRHIVSGDGNHQLQAGFSTDPRFLRVMYEHYDMNNRRRRTLYEWMEDVEPDPDEPLLGPAHATIYEVRLATRDPVMIQVFLAFLVDQCRVKFDFLAIAVPDVEKWLAILRMDGVNDILSKTSDPTFFSRPYPSFSIDPTGKYYIMFPWKRTDSEFDDLSAMQLMTDASRKRGREDDDEDEGEDTNPLKIPRWVCRYCGKLGAAFTNGIVLVCDTNCYDAFYLRAED
jgi:hypothetical protein